VFELSMRQFRAGFSPIDPLVSAVYKHIEEVANRKTLVTEWKPVSPNSTK